MNNVKQSAHKQRYIFAKNMRKVRRWKDISQETLALIFTVSLILSFQVNSQN